MKYALGNVFLELTRRCNMKCAHCLRGTAQCKDMSDEVMDAALAKMKLATDYDRVTLAGGEMTLVPERVIRLGRVMTDMGIYPGQFGLVTNGKRMPERFMKALGEISNQSEVSISVSNDDMHEPIDPKKLETLLGKLEDVTRDENRFKHSVPVYGMHSASPFGTGYRFRNNPDQVLMMGRGAEWGGYQPLVITPYRVWERSEDEPALYEEDFYVDVDGNVWPWCDLSYKFMRVNKQYCLGNVTDPEFDWLRAAVLFNMRMASRFGEKVVEPGWEPAATRDTWAVGRDYSGDVSRTYEIAKELNIGGTVNVK